MKDLFYYSFVMVTLFAKWVNPKNRGYLFSGWAFLSACLAANVISIIFWITLYNPNRLPSVLGIILAISILYMNYNFLLRNGKGEKIFQNYYEKFFNSKHRNWMVFLLIFYVLLSFCTITYLAYLHRQLF